MVCKYVRGMMYWCTLPRLGGHIQDGRRPIIIVSNDVNNMYSDNVMVVPCTTQIKREDIKTHYKFRVSDTDNLALCEQIQTVCKKSLDTFMGLIDNGTMLEIDKCIALGVGLADFELPPSMIEPEIEEIEEKEPEVILHMKMPTKKRKKNKRHTMEERKEFLKDYDTKGTEFVMNKYNLQKRNLVHQRAYMFRKMVKQYENKRGGK